MSDYIERCLNSLIIPDMSQLDILVINDGSNDDSSEKAKKIAVRYPDSIRVIDKENGNYGSCINRGLKEACGKYVKILDADDTFETENFEKYVELLKTIDCDLVLNDFCQVDANGKERKKIVFSELEVGKVYRFDEISIVFDKYKIAMHSVTYKMKIFEGLNYHQTEGISYTDDEWVFYPFVNVHTVLYSGLCLYRYLVGREGQTMSGEKMARNLKHIMSIIEKMSDYYERNISSISTASKFFFENRLKFKARSLFLTALYNLNIVDLKLIGDFIDYIKNKYHAVYTLLYADVLKRLGVFKLNYIKDFSNNSKRLVLYYHLNKIRNYL